MKKSTKIIAISSVTILILVGTSMYVIDRNEDMLNSLNIVEIDSSHEDETDTIVEDESGLTGLDVTNEVIEAVEIENSANMINTEVAEVIEVDEETDSITIENTDGDIVVTNDEALAQAEANSGADDILASIMSEYIVEDSNTEEKVDKAEVKVDKPEVKNSEEELKKAYSSETITVKKNDELEIDIDEQTKALFEEMGWGEPTLDHSRGNVIPEGVSIDDIETSIRPGITKGNPFYTP